MITVDLAALSVPIQLVVCDCDLLLIELKALMLFILAQRDEVIVPYYKNNRGTNKCVYVATFQNLTLTLSSQK